MSAQPALMVGKPAQLSNPAAAMAVIAGQLHRQLPISNRNLPETLSLVYGRHRQDPIQGRTAGTFNAAVWAAQCQHRPVVRRNRRQHFSFTGPELETEHG